MCYKVIEWMADSTLPFSNIIHTHTHTHIYIYIYIYFRFLQVELEFIYIQVGPAAFNGGVK